MSDLTPRQHLIQDLLVRCAVEAMGKLAGAGDAEMAAKRAIALIPYWTEVGEAIADKLLGPKG